VIENKEAGCAWIVRREIAATGFNAELAEFAGMLRRVRKPELASCKHDGA
jgi:hypothetical protein